MKRYKAYLRKCGRIHLLFYFENGANKPFNDRAVYKYTVLVSLPISRGTCYSDFNLSVPSYFYFLEYRDFFPPLDISISISQLLSQIHSRILSILVEIFPQTMIIYLNNIP